MSKPIILYFQQNSAFGSAETYLSDLAAHISKSDYNVHLVHPAIPELEAGFSPLQHHGITLHQMPAAHYSSNIAQILPFWIQFIISLRPTIIHFNDPCVVGSVAAWFARVPIRVMMHHTPELERQSSRVGYLMERIAFRSYTRCIFSNQISRATGIKRDKLSENQTAIIPFGLQPKWFAPIDVKQRSQLRAKFGFADKDVIILCPARLSRQKRHDVLLEAARQVLSVAPNSIFLLAGNGELRTEIETLLQALQLGDRVRLLGHISDIIDLMTASDILVLSSDFEGFPYSILEGSACGLPIVSTEVGGVSQSVLNGETGLLVPPGDSDALAAALLKLISDPARRETLGRAGRQRAEQVFTLERMVTDTEALYRTLGGLKE